MTNHEWHCELCSVCARVGAISESVSWSTRELAGLLMKEYPGREPQDLTIREILTVDAKHGLGSRVSGSGLGDAEGGVTKWKNQRGNS